MTTIATSNWSSRNVWPLANGTPAVRPGLASLYSAPASTRIVAAFSERCPRTDAMFHYVFTMSTSTTPIVLCRILDENMVEFAQVDTKASGIPVGISRAVVGDEILITSPSFATLWGLVGSGLVPAVKIDANISTLTTLNVPRGICASWAGRAVVVDGNSLYFSDALAPRTFTSDNFLDPPGGSVFGLHVSLGGSLIIATTTGVWALPEDAATGGPSVLGVWSKLTDYTCVNYNTTCVSLGNVYGLTRKGYRRIDAEGAQDVPLDEPNITGNSASTTMGRIAVADYRSHALFGGQAGPIVALGESGDTHQPWHMTDLAAQSETWWVYSAATAGTSPLVGIGEDQDGRPLYATEAAILRLEGSVDSTTPLAHLKGRLVTAPQDSPVLRWVTFASDTNSMRCSIFGTGTLKLPPQAAPIAGTTAWGAGPWREPPLRSRRFNFTRRTDDVAVEITVSGYPSRIPESADFDFSGPGPQRESN